MKTRKQDGHPQAPILENGEIIFSVDKKLQSLIQFYVDNDILTFNSCQDNVEGTCWIEYELGDWIKLSGVSFHQTSQELYRFIEASCQVLLLSSDDGHPDDADEYWIEGENLIWSASVRFPKKLLGNFERLVRRAVSSDE